MIVLVTTRGNGYTLRSLVRGTFGVATPTFRITHYERLLRAWWLPRATYIFADFERLAAWELRQAADLFRTLAGAGLRCLNDPARAMSRVELLTALHQAGINPFRAARADEAPHPSRFPVFLRSEDDHAQALPRLLHDQGELDDALADLRAGGMPLRGMMVVELAAQRYNDTLWAKWGTWRVGDRVIVEHMAVDDNWLVKIGDAGKMTDATTADEREAVLTNRFAPELKRAFEVAGIEFGRADHAVIDGRSVVYEINTNPYLGPLGSTARPMSRAATNLIARARIAEALAAIDTPETGWVRVPASPGRRRLRWWRPGFVTPRRP